MSILSKLVKKRLIWRIWGTEISMDVPRYREDIMNSPATLSCKPGHETPRFYDIAYNVKSGDRIEIDQLSLGFNKMTSTEDYFDDSILIRTPGKAKDGERFWESDKGLYHVFMRNRFTNTWRQKLKSEFYALVARGYVYRDSFHGSLYSPENIKKAHIKYLEFEYKNRLLCYEECEEKDEFMNDASPEYKALNWRTREAGGYIWQGYDVFDGKGKYGEFWLFPLSQSHYIGIELAISTSKMRYYEHIKKLDSFIDNTLRSIRINSESRERLTHLLAASWQDPLCEINPVVMGYSDEQLLIWRRLNTEEGRIACLSKMYKLKRNIKQMYREWNILFVFIVLIILLTCLFLGQDNFFEWMRSKNFPYPEWFIFLAYALFGFQSMLGNKIAKIKEASLKYFERKRSNS